MTERHIEILGTVDCVGSYCLCVSSISDMRLELGISLWGFQIDECEMLIIEC